MIIEVKIPSPGESITEVELAAWHVEDGAIVEKDQEIAEIESDKATLPLIAEEGGQIKLMAAEGDTIEVGSVACTIDTEKAGTGSKKTDDKTEAPKTKDDQKTAPKQEKSKKTEKKESKQENKPEHDLVKLSPLAKKLMNENNLSMDDVLNGLHRISKGDIEAVLQLPDKEIEKTENASTGNTNNEFIKPENRDSKTEKMSSLRRKISERLVAVKNETAMLTTFNEVDMSAVMDLRKKYQKFFVEKYGVKVGFMSFFIKAATQALFKYPNINAQLDGEKILYFDYADIGIAVQSAKGLMVPVIRNTQSMSLAEIELAIKDYAQKGRNNKISLDEMTGGTFTITNGGTFGSLMSTPIINPPQSGILGMHNIVERPMAIDGKVEIRPMMYIALSYDHRIIDGKSAVEFLVTLKDLLEAPYKLLFGGNDPEKMVLGL